MFNLLKKSPYIIATLILSVLTFWVYSFGFIESVDRIMIRFTAKSSFFLFIMSFIASPLCRLWKNDWTATLLKYRRQIGISFAVSHTFHLAFILLLQFYFNAQNFEERGLGVVMGGAIAYLFLYLMAFTSNDHMVRRMGKKNWKKLHTLGSYYIIIVFSVSYIPRALENYSYLPFALIIIFSVLLKLWNYKMKWSSSKT